MTAARRLPALLTVAAILGGTFVAGGASATGATTTAQPSGPESREYRIAADWLATSWTVPENTVGPIEISMAGSAGTGEKAGAGAAFTFTAGELAPGTVLDVRFGAQDDGRFPALAGGAAGRGESAAQSGTAGGDAAMVLRHPTGDVCEESADAVLAVAAGGGGMSGGTKRTSVLFGGDRWISRPVAGAPATGWTTDADAAIGTACAPAPRTHDGEKWSGERWTSWPAGGGGGGGLPAGSAGVATRTTGTQKVTTSHFFGLLEETRSVPIIQNATGGGGGSSYLSERVCADACAQPAITANAGQGYVVFRWKQKLTTRISVNDYSGRKDQLRGWLTGAVWQSFRSSDTVGYETVPHDSGTLNVWKGDQQIAQRRTEHRSFGIDIHAHVSVGVPVTLRIDFIPDDPTKYLPSSTTTTLLPVTMRTIMDVASAVFAEDGSHWLYVYLSRDSPPSVRERRPRLALTLDGDDATTRLLPTGEVKECALVQMPPGDHDVVAAYAGTVWDRPIASAPFRYSRSTATLQTGNQNYYNWCERVVYSELATSDGSSVASSAASVLDAAPAAGFGAASLTWAGSDDPVPFGGEVALSVDVAHGGTPTNEGEVEFFVDGVSAGTADAPVDGRFTLTVPTPVSGAHTVDAVYADPADGTGEPSHDGALAEDRTLTVAPEPYGLTVVVEGIDEAGAGGEVSLRANADSDSDEEVEGSVAFFDDERYLGEATLHDGIATLEGVTLDEVRNTVRATFQGDLQRWADPGVAETAADYRVSETSLSLTISAERFAADSDGRVLIELRGDSPDGEASLRDGDDELVALTDADAVTPAAGVAAAWSVPLSRLPVGELALSAVFAGDPGIGSSATDAIAVEVTTRATSVDAHVADGMLHLAVSASQASVDPDAAGARPSGIAAVWHGDHLLGYLDVQDGEVSAPLPASATAADTVGPVGGSGVTAAGPEKLRIEFRPLSTDLAASSTTVAFAATTGALAVTGQSSPLTIGLWGAIALALGLLIRAGSRGVTRRRRP
jgi:hypothetical protein